MAYSYYESAMYGDESNTLPEPLIPEPPKYHEQFYVDYETWKHELELNPNTIGVQSGSKNLEMKVVSGIMHVKYGNNTEWRKETYRNNNTFFDLRKEDSDDYIYWIKACGLPLTTENIINNWET